jgi:tRNA (guanine37-N1)-methyltransferase
MVKLRSTFITSFKEPLTTWLNSSIIGRAHQNNILDTAVISILEKLSFDHHAIDDTPYGGGPGELMKIDILGPMIKTALSTHEQIPRAQKRVLLMDPAGLVFTQEKAYDLSTYQELIFISGRYEGIDARIHYYVDEALSIGDFVLSSGDLAAMAIFDATARFVDGVLGNNRSHLNESHQAGRLENSLYTRPRSYDGYHVPDVFCRGNHKEIKQAQELESIIKTKSLRPDLLQKYPLEKDELSLLKEAQNLACNYPWMKSHE